MTNAHSLTLRILPLGQQHQKIPALHQQLNNKSFETILIKRQTIKSEQHTKSSKFVQQHPRHS